MRAVRAPLPLLGIATAVTISGCFTTRRPAPATVELPPSTAPLPVAPQAVPDAIPRAEPRARFGNPPYYDVFGKRYYVLSSSADFVERGVASWYGPGFHQLLTSTREPYDMYGMTAAHRTLPLPAYVRVTNLQNGRSVVVRVNDRGPFVGNRIIDLSYTAAAKLDMLRNGTALVEVRSVDVEGPPQGADAPLLGPAVAAAANMANSTGASSAAAGNAALFVQAGAFSDPANAERLAAKLRTGAYGKIWVRDDVIAGRRMYRVRIGPVANVEAFDSIYAALERDGVHDARLALD